MAGVPRTDGATLWTRVPRGVFEGDAELAVVVSKNRDLSSPVIVETVIAEKQWDGCVHFQAAGLAPGAEYFYQFRGKDTASPIGRFQTLRPADSNEPVRIGFFTCQGFTEGYYATHRHLAQEDLDLVVCLGDYVYEATVPGVRGIDLNLYPQILPTMRAKYTLLPQRRRPAGDARAARVPAAVGRPRVPQQLQQGQLDAARTVLQGEAQRRLAHLVRADAGTAVRR